MRYLPFFLSKHDCARHADFPHPSHKEKSRALACYLQVSPTSSPDYTYTMKTFVVLAAVMAAPALADDGYVLIAEISKLLSFPILMQLL